MSTATTSTTSTASTNKAAPGDYKKPNLPGAIISLSTENAKKQGILTTQELSKPDQKSVQQYSSVALFTIHPRDLTSTLDKLFLQFGVYYEELAPLTLAEFAQLKQPYFLPSLNYAFCLSSVHEFVFDVLQNAKGYLYWPRTDRFYAIPQWYVAKIQEGLKSLQLADALSPSLSK